MNISISWDSHNIYI